MAYTQEQLLGVLDSWERHCFYCDKRLVFENYGQFGRSGAWEVARVHAKAHGGKDDEVNLVPACISCNREVGARVSLYDNARKYIKPSAWPTVVVLGISILAIGIVQIVRFYMKQRQARPNDEVS